MTFFLIVLVIIFIIIYVFSTYNGLVKVNNIVKEAFSTMDVYLKKRWDLVPNLVETVKAYEKHENETFTKVASLRKEAYDNMSTNKKINVNEQLEEGISKIMAISENYPELKASEIFSKLSSELTKLEDEIANSRKYYNGAVRMLNNKVEMFPSNIVAKIFGFKQVSMFSAGAEEKNNMKVEL